MASELPALPVLLQRSQHLLFSGEPPCLGSGGFVPITVFFPFLQKAAGPRRVAEKLRNSTQESCTASRRKKTEKPKAVGF